MPRRHNRDGLEPEPLSITPADVPKPRRRERTASREAQREQDRKYREACHDAARRKRVSAAIDWEMCCIPGCGTRVRVSEFLRDVDRQLPICWHHGVVIRAQMEPWWQDGEILRERAKVQAMKDQQVDAQSRAITIAENGRHGQVYFLRANGLIKVGWSSDLEKRLKAYGPDVELLCHYQGSRQDETLMHRQLRPYLAKGREWFKDCNLIEDVIADVVKRHGPPRMAAYWTEPKPDVIKPHRWSA